MLGFWVRWRAIFRTALESIIAQSNDGNEHHGDIIIRTMRDAWPFLVTSIHDKQ